MRSVMDVSPPNMDQERRTYYCSSPALDWRLRGSETITGELRPDPILYSTQESWDRLHQHVNLQHGVGLPPPAPPSLPAVIRRAIPIANPSLRRAMAIKGEMALPALRTERRQAAVKTAPIKAAPRSPTTLDSHKARKTTIIDLAASEEVASSRPQATYLRSKKTAQSTVPDPATPTIPQKRKLLSDTPSLTTRSTTCGKGMKWNEEEDECIWKAIIQAAEKGIDWKRVTQDVNLLRSPDKERTMNSVKKHWIQTMKPRPSSRMDGSGR